MGADINCRLPELFIPFEQIRNNSHGCFRLDGGILVHLPLASTSSDSKRSRFSLLATRKRLQQSESGPRFLYQLIKPGCRCPFPLELQIDPFSFMMSLSAPTLSILLFFFIYLFCAML
jgi:hypothetical protein